jgi:hypothetical protein
MVARGSALAGFGLTFLIAASFALLLSLGGAVPLLLFVAALTALVYLRRRRARHVSQTGRRTYDDSTSFFERERAVEDMARRGGYLIVLTAILLVLALQVLLGFFMTVHREESVTADGLKVLRRAVRFAGRELAFVEARMGEGRRRLGGDTELVAGPSRTRARWAPLLHADVTVSPRVVERHTIEPSGRRRGISLWLVEWEFRFGVPTVRTWEGMETVEFELGAPAAAK